MTVTFCIIDDHPIVRSGLNGLVAARYAGATIEEAETLSAALCLIRDGLRPDVVLCDLALPDADGFMAIATVVSACPRAAVLAMSGRTDQNAADGALAAGAREFFSKSGSSRELHRIIQRLLNHRATGQADFEHNTQPEPQAAAGKPALGPLPPRMAQVAALCAAGHRNKAIAELLDISDNTVRAHVSALLQRFRLTSRHDLRQLAAQFDTVTLPPPDRTRNNARMRLRHEQAGVQKK